MTPAAPMANPDTATVDQGTSVDIDVAGNDVAYAGGLDLGSIVITSPPSYGQLQVNGDGSVNYTHDGSNNCSDSFSYTITDGTLNSLPATVSIDVLAPVTDIALYVYDIRFESKRGNKDWRAVFEIRSDSDGNGVGEGTDSLAAGVQITVQFAGITYTGVTGSDGVFRTSWINNLSSGDYYANVLDLVMAGYYWDPLSTLNMEDDSDGDGLPDDLLIR